MCPSGNTLHYLLYAERLCMTTRGHWETLSQKSPYCQFLNPGYGMKQKHLLLPAVVSRCLGLGSASYHGVFFIQLSLI